MYPKLRPDIYITESPAGAIVVVDGKATHLKGKHAAILLERLVPHLDGTRSVEDLTASLPAEKARVVAQILELLASVSAVRDASVDRQFVLDGELASVYTASLGYLETLGEGAVRRFLGLRDARLTIIGGGAAVRTLASGLWESGVRRGVVLLPDGDAHAAPLRELLAEHSAVDAALDFRIEHRGEALFDPPDELLRGSSLVIAAGPARALESLNMRCISLGVELLPVVLARGYGFIGPRVRPGEPGCLACACARVEPSPPDRPADDHGWSFLGARAAVEAFKALAGLPVTCEQALLRIDAEDLTDSVHPLHRAGDCPACARPGAPVPADMPWPQDEPEPRALPPSAVPWIDAFAGLLSSVDPEDWPQLPLCLWSVQGRRSEEPALLLPGKDHESARLRCVVAGLQARLPPSPPGGAPLFLLPSEPPDRLVAVEPPVEAVSWCRAAGWSLAECIGQGVLSLAQKEMMPPRQGSRLSMEILSDALDEDASFWWKTLGLRYDLDVEAWSVSHPLLPIVAVEVCAGSAPLAFAAGRSLSEALKTSLLIALGTVQARGSRGPQSQLHLGAPDTAMRVEPSAAAPAPPWQAWLQTLTGRALYLALAPRDEPLRASGLSLGWVGWRRDTR